MLAPLFTAVALSSLLTVQAASGSPSSASVPPGARGVPVLEVRLTASCTRNIAVRSITVLHRGMGDRRDIASLYAVNGGRRVSRPREIASSRGDVALTFTPPVIVPACGTEDLSILADFSGSAATSGEHRIVLADRGAVETDGSAVRLLPAASILHRTAGEEQGSVSVAFLPLLARVRYGDARVVARLTLAASDFDQFVSAMTLTNDGSARDRDLQNLVLVTRRGEVLARAAALDGDGVPFILDSPLLLPRGETVRLDVRADVRASARRTIGFRLEEPSDLTARRARVRR